MSAEAISFSYDSFDPLPSVVRDGACCDFHARSYARGRCEAERSSDREDWSDEPEHSLPLPAKSIQTSRNVSKAPPARRQWQAVEPESVKLEPAAGRNCQS